MATKLFIKQSIVSSDDLDYENVACPECGDNNSIIISGYLMIPREEIFEKGVMKTDRNNSAATSFDVRQIKCLSCQTNSIVEDVNIYALKKSNLILNEKIRKLSGEDLLSIGPIN